MKKFTSIVLILVGLVHAAIGTLTVKIVGCALIIAIVCAIVKLIDILLKEEYYDDLPERISTCLWQMTIVYWFAGLGWYNALKEIFTIIATPKMEGCCEVMIIIFTSCFVGLLIDGIYEKSYD